MVSSYLTKSDKRKFITLSASILASVSLVSMHQTNVQAEELSESTTLELWEAAEEVSVEVLAEAEAPAAAAEATETTEVPEVETTLEETVPYIQTEEYQELVSELGQELADKNQEVIDLNIELYGEVNGGRGDAVLTQGTVGSRTTHTVQRGEWVAKIAGMYGVTTEQVRQWNNLPSNLLIHPGDVLIVSAPVSSGENTTPAPAPTPAPTPSTPDVNTPATPNSSTVHTVTRGEFLWLIGQRYGVTVDQLIEWNNLSSNMLYVGDRLLVSDPSVPEVPTPAPTPTPTPTPKPEDKPETPTTPSARKTYSVIRGDYLYKIATEYGVTVNDLREWNNMTSNYVYVGDKLFVEAPKAEGPTPTPTPTPEPEPKPTPSPTPENKPEKEEETGSEDVDTVIIRDTYTVRPGEFINLIASKHGITAQQLREWNNLTSNLIHPGDVLFVSEPREAVTNEDEVDKDDLDEAINDLVEEELEKNKNDEANEEKDEENNDKNEEESDDNSQPQPDIEFVMPDTHTVKTGEYLYLIASQHGITVQNLQDWNQLTTNILRTGQVLIVSNPADSIIVDGDVYNPEVFEDDTVEWPHDVTPEAVAKQLNIPIMSQFDPRWKDARYGNDVSRTIWENGCAIVALAMIDSYFQGEVVNPADIAEWAGLDHYVWGAGTAWSAFPAFAQERGYQITNHGRNVNAALDQVEAGNPVLVSVRPGYFITGGHLMVVRGYDRATDTVYVNDPYDNPNRVKSNSTVGHSARHLRNDTAGIWSFSKLR